MCLASCLYDLAVFIGDRKKFVGGHECSIHCLLMYGGHFYVMYPTPAESCFFLTKRRLMAIISDIAVTFCSLMTLSAVFIGKCCTSFGFDSGRGFVCDMWLTIGFVKTGK